MDAVERTNQLHAREIRAVQLGQHGLHLRAVEHAHDRRLDDVVEVVAECDLVAAERLRLAVKIAAAHAGAEITGRLLAVVGNIKNVGFQKGEALEKLIREARFSIYPSEWYENCPFSVMESQMYGTPVLGADIGGIPELIQVGKTGELFESGDSDELKSKIQKLWGDKKLCDEYSKNCKGISFDTIDEYYEKIMRVY
mgnify:CR=1 FL=1